MWIILGCQEASLRIGHPTEVVLDVLGKVPRRLDIIQRAEPPILRCIFASSISERGGDVGCGDGRVGAFLSGGKIAAT